MADEKDFIEELLELYEKEQQEELQDAPTFLQLIGRSAIENYISRMLAYALKNDNALMWQLLKIYGTVDGECPKDFEVDTVSCEKTMYSGRADVFVKAKHGAKMFTLTLENKTLSKDHGNQTDIYYKYVCDHYVKCKNAFIFLKPWYNHTTPTCEKFKVITYDDLCELWSSESDDYRIKDLKIHIGDFLVKKEIELTELEKKAIENLSKLREALNNAEDKLNLFRDGVFNELCMGKLIEGLEFKYENLKKRKAKDAILGVKENQLVPYLVDKDTVLQIYRANKWYHYENEGLKESYYFYVEIKFENNDPSKIFVQKVIKRYGAKAEKEESAVSKFIKITGLKGDWGYDTWYVISPPEQFSCDKDIFSIEWKDKLLEWASENLNKCVKEMDELFKDFQEWKAKQPAE